MKKPIIIFICLITYSLQAQVESEARDEANYYWAELNAGLSSLGLGRNMGVTANVAIGHHLFSTGLQGYGYSFPWNPNSSRPSGDFADSYEVLYGYIKKASEGYFYGKAGISLVKYQKLVEVIPHTGWFAFDESVYENKTLPGLPIELGAALKFKFVSLGAYTSLLVCPENAVINLGIKLGFGDLN